MQRLLLVLALTLGASDAFAQADEQPRSLDSMSQREREHEMQAQNWQGPSGFWTSPHKATHGAYRYRLMGIGAVLLVITGLGTWRLIKRANDDRDVRLK